MMINRKIIFLYLFSFTLSISPLLTYLIANRDRYFCTKYDAIKMFSGGFIIAFMLLLKTVKKLKVPSGVFLFALICILSYLLAPVMRDLTVLSFLALVGELGDLTVQYAIARERRKLSSRETAKQIKSIMESRG